MTKGDEKYVQTLTPSAKAILPWILFIGSIFIFMNFILSIQEQNDTERILKELKENKEIIGHLNMVT